MDDLVMLFQMCHLYSIVFLIDNFYFISSGNINLFSSSRPTNQQRNQNENGKEEEEEGMGRLMIEWHECVSINE